MAFSYPKKTGTLLEGLVAQTFHFLQSLTVGKSAVLVAVLHYLVGQRGTDAADIAEQFTAGGIQFHADAVDAALHHIAQAGGQHLLVDIMLVLPHPDALGVDLHQFGEGVHQTAADTDRAAHGDIIFREFAAGHIAGAIDRCASFAHANGDNLILEATTLYHLLGLAASSTVTDGYSLDMEGFDKGL